MSKFRPWFAGFAGLVLVSGVALAAGFTTSGLPTLPLVGTTAAPGSYGQLYGSELVAVDTGIGNGQNPQSVAANAAQIAAIAGCYAANTATLSTNAVTKNTQCANVTSESLTTAAGASITITVTNSLVTATSSVSISAFMLSSTTGKPQIQSITPASGSFTAVLKNVGSAAFNGTLILPFYVALP